MMSSDLKKSKMTAADFSKQIHSKNRKFLIWTVALSFIMGAAYVLTQGNAIVPVAIVAVVAIVIVVVQYPRSVFYITLLGAIIVESFFLNFPDSITDRIPLFWDVNSVVQVYLHKSDFHAVPLSVFEVLVVLSGLSWLLKSIYFNRLSVKWGPLIIPIGLYVTCVFCGLLHGLTSGGLFNMALFEVRAQFYFLLAYLMAINTAPSPEKMINNILWMSAIGIGIKGVLSSLRFIVTLHGTTIPEVGIGAHEESFFFNCFEFELMVLSLAKVKPKLVRIMLFFLPFVLLANLANERRAATAALGIISAIMLSLAAVCFPARRKVIAVTVITVAAILSVYLPIEWNGTTTFAQPARAIKSQFAPDERDALSNAYRDDENINLMFTLRTDPIFGYGYGKPFLETIQMIDLTSVDPFVHYMTHNQILWVWMRVGTIGFFCFWIMVTSILIKACQVLRHPMINDEIRAAALLCVLITAMQMIFGLLDLQISCIRNMLYCGLWAGTIGSLSMAYPPLIDQKEVLAKSLIYVRWNLPKLEQPQS